jgi:hypothetical protein
MKGKEVRETMKSKKREEIKKLEGLSAGGI